jgi:hypothetical protein
MTNQDLVTAEDKLKLLFEHRPWETEPDEAEWVDAQTKYKCRILRNDQTGTLCGYVEVPEGHKMYGVSYQELEKQYSIPVHGGLTFSGGLGRENVVDGWYFGFDTAHAGDFSPGLAISMIKWASTAGVARYHKGETYRTWDYVVRDVNMLAFCLQGIDGGVDGGVDEGMRHVS